MIAADSIILATVLVNDVMKEAPADKRPDGDAKKRMIIRIGAAIEANVLTLGDRVLLDHELKSLKAASDIVRQVFREETGWEPSEMILPAVFEQRCPLPEIAAEYGMPIPTRRRPSKEAVAIFGELIENPDLSREYERKTILLPEYSFDAGDPKHLVAVSKGNPRDKFRLLDKALENSCFFEHLDGVWKESGKSKSEFSIIIKAHFIPMLRRDETGVYTDPTLVLRLLSRLRESGYGKVAVVEGRNSFGNFLGGRGVTRVAARAGYVEQDSIPIEGKAPDRVAGKVLVNGKLETFEVVDLSSELVEHDFSPDLLGRHPVSRIWRDADYRISFGKMKTHFSARYALNLINISLALPAEDMILQYPTQFDAAKAVTALLEAFPVHFSIIDAITASDGVIGYVRRPRSRMPGIIVAGQNVLAVESLCAQMMGADPFESVFTRVAAKRLGGMTPYKVVGSSTLLYPWRNVRNVFVETVTAFLEKLPRVANFWLPLMVGDPDSCFPVKGDMKHVQRLRWLSWILGSRPLGFWLMRRDGLVMKLKNSRQRKKVERAAFTMPLSAGYPDFYEEARHLDADDMDILERILRENGPAIQKGERKVVRAGHHILVDDIPYAVTGPDAIGAISVGRILKGVAEGRWTASQVIPELDQWRRLRLGWRERRRLKKK